MVNSPWRTLFEQLNWTRRKRTGQDRVAAGAALSDPLTLILLERFVSQRVFSRHIAADCFQRFQLVRTPLPAAPAEAVTLEPISD
jgi:quinol monooxygenase YgiN